MIPDCIIKINSTIITSIFPWVLKDTKSYPKDLLNPSTESNINNCFKKHLGGLCLVDGREKLRCAVGVSHGQ